MHSFSAPGHEYAAATLSAQSQILTRQMPEGGITLSGDPFIVGRTAPGAGIPKKVRAQLHDYDGLWRDHGEPSANFISPTAHLAVLDDKPYRMSRFHFLIQQMPDGGYILRDLCSSIGTYVNEQLFGESFGSYFARLNPGDNTISIGKGDTPFRFKLTIDPK